VVISKGEVPSSKEVAGVPTDVMGSVLVEEKRRDWVCCFCWYCCLVAIEEEVRKGDSFLVV